MTVNSRLWKASGIMLVLLGLSACGRRNMDAGIMYEGIESGNVCEITGNEFVNGLQHEFTESELSDWKRWLDSGEYKQYKEKIDQDEIKYIMCFYDGGGQEVLSLALDQELNLYSEDGYRIEGKLTESMMDPIKQGR